MSRHTRAAEEDAFSLFPFLAVLLCTMGTLALVFVLIAQKSTEPAAPEAEVASVEFDSEAALGDDAQYGAIIDANSLAGAMTGGFGVKRRPVDSLAEPEATADDDSVTAQDDDAYEQALLKTGAASIDDLVAEKESVEWFLEELEEIGKRNLETLDEKRERLANAEAGIAKLREESEVAKQRYDALMAENAETPDADALRDKVAELDREIEKLTEEASKLREENRDAKKSYAIVPYQGKKGTFRRPIYVECRGDGVYIQPEYIRFDERDFLLAQFPSNPFDVALRAAAQRYLAAGGQRTAKGEIIEPYPLIIVRPSGSKYFYAAIAALASWGELYGYEFVEEDQELAYPAPDPVLAKNALDQANAARQRMEAQLATAISVRNAQIVASERLRANAQHGGFGDGATVGGAPANSALQSRLGSNVRLGAAQPLAGKARPALPAPNRGGPGPMLAANGAAPGGIPVGMPGGVPSVVSATSPTQGAGNGMNAPTQGGGFGGYGGAFTSAANSATNSAAQSASSAAGIVGGDSAPLVPYTGQYAQNMTLAPEGGESDVADAAQGGTEESVPAPNGTDAAALAQGGTGVGTGVGTDLDVNAGPTASDDGTTQSSALAADNGAGAGSGSNGSDGAASSDASVAANGAAGGYPAGPSDGTTPGGQTQYQYFGNAAAQAAENVAAQAQTQVQPQNTNSAPMYMKDLVATPDQPQQVDPSQARDLTNTLGNTTYAAGATGESGDGELADSASAPTASYSSSAAGAAGDPNAADSNAQGMPNVFNKTVDLNEEPPKKKEQRPEDAMPKEAYLVSRELTRTATRGSERGVVVQCTARGYVFPKQPGLRKACSVAYETPGQTRADRDAELADVVTLCVKSWGLAGRNMYWAPYMKVEVAKGGEAGLEELREFCEAQGLPLVLADELNGASDRTQTAPQGQTQTQARKPVRGAGARR